MRDPTGAVDQGGDVRSPFMSTGIFRPPSSGTVPATMGTIPGAVSSGRDIYNNRIPGLNMDQGSFYQVSDTEDGISRIHMAYVAKEMPDKSDAYLRIGDHIFMCIADGKGNFRQSTSDHYASSDIMAIHQRVLSSATRHALLTPADLNRHLASEYQRVQKILKNPRQMLSSIINKQKVTFQEIEHLRNHWPSENDMERLLLDRSSAPVAGASVVIDFQSPGEMYKSYYGGTAVTDYGADPDKATAIATALRLVDTSPFNCAWACAIKSNWVYAGVIAVMDQSRPNGERHRVSGSSGGILHPTLAVYGRTPYATDIFSYPTPVRTGSPLYFVLRKGEHCDYNTGYRNLETVGASDDADGPFRVFGASTPHEGFILSAQHRDFWCKPPVPNSDNVEETAQLVKGPYWRAGTSLSVASRSTNKGTADAAMAIKSVRNPTAPVSQDETRGVLAHVSNIIMMVNV